MYLRYSGNFLKSEKEDENDNKKRKRCKITRGLKKMSKKRKFSS